VICLNRWSPINSAGEPKMLQFVITETKKYGLESIVLNVNKNNNAILAYEHLGFKKIQEERKEIGNGFIMDDYVYEYKIED
jgi:ribosomal protein S18 acetylase RimI-like enzyme